MPTKKCKTCKWAEWQKTPMGNIERKLAGQCRYPIVAIPNMPECSRALHQPGQNSILSPSLSLSSQCLNDRNGIWPADGTECSCYAKIANCIKPLRARFI